MMGVLNVTPDSFSDGGRYVDSARAIARGLQMAAEGAAILDIGGESSRPGAEPVPTAEELCRVVPVIEGLAGRTECLISVDTAKATVAEAALAAGAQIVNDITALRGDPNMASVVARSGAGLVLMHMQGTPRTMQAAPHYDNVVREVKDFLADRMAAACRSGIESDRIALDPGIGFGKTLEHNLTLLRNLRDFHALGRPLLVGLSRKSFLGQLTGRPVSDRLLPSLAALAFALGEGAQLARVHDVKESCELAHLIGILQTGRVTTA